MYPVVWSAEGLIWQRDHEALLSIDGEPGAEGVFDGVSKAREECYERARAIVRGEMRRQANTLEWSELDDIKAKKHEFTLVDGSGHAAFSTVLPKRDWGSLLEICLCERMNEAGRFLVEHLTWPIWFGMADAVWDRDYRDLLGAGSDGDDARPTANQLAMTMDQRCALMKANKQRILHCME